MSQFILTVFNFYICNYDMWFIPSALIDLTIFDKNLIINYIFFIFN